MKRKHISWKTKCAAALVHCNIIPREEAKLLEEDQLLSLFQWDHNEFYTLNSEGRDKFWNLTPMLIMTHRQKTKADAKVIAKSKRIRAKQLPSDDLAILERQRKSAVKEYARKLASRGFDKTRRRKMDGTVVKREG